MVAFLMHGQFERKSAILVSASTTKQTPPSRENFANFYAYQYLKPPLRNGQSIPAGSGSDSQLMSNTSESNDCRKFDINTSDGGSALKHSPPQELSEDLCGIVKGVCSPVTLLSLSMLRYLSIQKKRRKSF